MKKTLALISILVAGQALATTYPMTLHHLEWGADPEGYFHGTAFNFLAPKGWKPFSQTGWNLVDTKNVNLIAGAQSPDERFGYSFCPGFWQIFNGSTGGGYGRTRISGNKIGMEPPARLSEFMPTFLGMNKLEGYHLDRHDDRPVKTPLHQGERGGAVVSSVAFSYTLHGQPMEGVMYGRMDISIFGNPNAAMSTYYGSWGLTSLFCVTYPKGEAQKGMRFFSLAVPTYTPTLAFARAVAVHDAALKAMYAGIAKEAVDRSRIMAQVNAEREDAIMGRYRESHAASDQAQSAFCDMIGGIDRYRTADGSELQLASGYKDGWINRAGDVVLSDNIGYDPNQGSGGGWTRMRKG